MSIKTNTYGIYAIRDLQGYAAGHEYRSAAEKPCPRGSVANKQREYSQNLCRLITSEYIPPGLPCNYPIGRISRAPDVAHTVGDAVRRGPGKVTEDANMNAISIVSGFALGVLRLQA
jgi:hypothetical protein